MQKNRRWSSVVPYAGAILASLVVVSVVWAQGPPPPAGSWRPDSLLAAIGSTLIFGLIGIFMAILGFKLFDLLTPFNLEQEICEKQNIAVAIVCAGMVLGICLIIVASVL